MVSSGMGREYIEDVKKLLIKHGFSKEGKADIDNHEEAPTVFVDSAFPKPESRRHLVTESYQLNVEESYFWLYNFITEKGYADVIKVSDYFTSSESSAFFGINQQRLAAQQEKVAQYLGTIANMIKSLFQLVREMRILDERLDLYKQSFEKKDQTAEVSLKGYWIDLVEGGPKNPASVYGMARDLGFATLPDLFFSAPVMTSEGVDAHIKTLEFNRKVKEVLSRKLKVFLIWKEHTYKELADRRKFTLKYLHQHYNVINMYSQWIIPYLKNIKRMTHKDFTDHPELIAGFEGTIMEIELLAVKNMEAKTEYVSCVDIYFFYRTQPAMSFQTEGYNRGPLHVGKIEIDFRGYAWSKEQIKKYQEFRKAEKQDILMSLNQSVKDAYEALGTDLQNYLAEAKKYQEEGKLAGKKPEAVKPESTNPFTPFMQIGGGFLDLFGGFFQVRCPKCGRMSPFSASNCQGCGAPFAKKTKKDPTKYKLFTDYTDAKSTAVKDVWTTYNTYKKAHRMITW